MNKTKKILNKFFDYIIIFLYKMLVDETKDNYTDKTVNKTSSTRKCSKNSDLQETPFKKNELNSKQVKNSIIDWIASFNHTHFLTLQLPNNIKTANYEASKYHLRNIMAEFQRQLLGKHWNKKHLLFMAFAEKGKSEGWHYHILFDAGKFKTEELKKALNKATKSRNLSPNIFYLEEIDQNKNKLYSYCTKEIKIKNNDNFNCDNIILSGDLFNIR